MTYIKGGCEGRKIGNTCWLSADSVTVFIQGKHVCMYMNICIGVYSLYVKYLLSRATGWTWGHRAVAASPLLGHWIQQL